MYTKRHAASLLLGVLLAACGGTPGAPTPVASSPSPSPMPIATLASPTASPATSSVTTPAPSPMPTAAPPPALCPAPPVYVVRAGDNLWDIAMQNGVSVEALLAVNPQIGDRRVIRVGDEITISPIDLGTLGGDSSRASAINNRGQIVGTSDTASDGRHAFLWQDGEMTDLGTLGGGFSEAVAINDRGQVVGTSDTASDRRHAFLWENGSMIDLGTLGYSSEAVAINDGSQVVGWSEVAPTANDLLPRHAFLWQAGAMIDLGTLGGDSSEAVAINALGQVVGTIDQQRAFLWEAGTMTDLGPPDDFHGVAVAINDSGQIAIVRSPGAAVAINDHGQIVGGRYLSDMVVPGEIFLWQDGTTTDLGPLDGAFSWQDGTMTALGSLGDDFFSVASAINSRGQVVGSSLTAYPDPIEWEWCCSTLFHAFLWQNGSMIDLGDLGPLASRTSSDAAAVNDCGQVVGSSARTPGANGPWARFAQAPEHAALWYAPVP